jgi:hypothetical protein
MGPAIEVTDDPLTFLAAFCPTCPCPGFKESESPTPVIA